VATPRLSPFSLALRKLHKPKHTHTHTHTHTQYYWGHRTTTHLYVERPSSVNHTHRERERERERESGPFCNVAVRFWFWNWVHPLVWEKRRGTEEGCMERKTAIEMSVWAIITHSLTQFKIRTHWSTHPNPTHTQRLKQIPQQRSSGITEGRSRAWRTDSRVVLCDLRKYTWLRNCLSVWELLVTILWILCDLNRFPMVDMYYRAVWLIYCKYTMKNNTFYTTFTSK